MEPTSATSFALYTVLECRPSQRRRHSCEGSAPLAVGLKPDERTDMEHPIDQGTVTHVNVLSTTDERINHLTMFVHHQLTVEERHMLADYLETIAVMAVKLFASRL